MSNERDSAISISSDTKHEEDDITQMDEISSKEVAIKKSTSPSIESNTLDHVTEAPKRAIEFSSNSVTKSTTILDVDDGIGGKETATGIYKKLRENIVLGIVITVMCGIILTPIILFYTRPDFSNPFETSPMQAVSSHKDISFICYIFQHQRRYIYIQDDNIKVNVELKAEGKFSANSFH